MKKVVVIGLDGLEPTIVEPLIDAGELPSLAALRSQGGYWRLQTTRPAQTPVAWSSFATSTNPGGHGIFDFLRRDPATYLPDLALARHEQTSAYAPPRAVNLRGGVALWDVLSGAGVPSVVLRCPCTYPPDRLEGRMLAGLGVPDLRGGLGTGTFYTTRTGVEAGEGEQVVTLRLENGRASTRLIGPRARGSREDVRAELSFDVDHTHGRVVVRSAGRPRSLDVRIGTWSDWLDIRFRLGFLQSVRGVVRFHVARLDPEVEIYATPVNFHPASPPFPISAPPQFAGDLARRIGLYYTTGLVEEHRGLANGRFDEEVFLDQCQAVMHEREQMLFAELERFDRGLVFCLFDTPDRLQHMLWRFREPDHPANRAAARPDLAGAIADHYRACDAVVGRVMAALGGDTLLLVLSDHGMTSFQRGVHLNGWLYEQGYLALKPGVRPGVETADFFHGVDWTRTRAYALGLAGIFLNVAGRERQGTLDADESPRLASAIVSALSGLGDPVRGITAVRRVHRRHEIYSGPYVADAPDLVVDFAPGYRASWCTALGGLGEGGFEDNTRRWGGDHIVDPDAVPGVLFSNRPFAGDRPSLLDMAPTILAALGVPAGPAMEGRRLI